MPRLAKIDLLCIFFGGNRQSEQANYQLQLIEIKSAFRQRRLVNNEVVNSHQLDVLEARQLGAHSQQII